MSSPASLIKACIKRFREQPPAPSSERTPLPFNEEDFWWKTSHADNSFESVSTAVNIESLAPSPGKLSTASPMMSFRQSFSLSLRSASPSDSIASFQSDGAVDLDHYASSLLAKCDSLMKEYEEKNASRQRVQLVSDEPSSDKHKFASSQASLTKEIPQSSADSIFPLYLSSSDDSALKEVTSRQPLSEAEVAPFLGDEVIGMMWRRLCLVRIEISKTP